MDPLFQALRRTTVFRTCRRPDANALAAFTEERRAAPHQRLFNQGDQADMLYLLLEGGVILSRRTNAHRDSIIELLTPGTCFYVPSLFDKDYAVSAETLAPCNLFAIRTQPLLAYLRTNVGLAWSLATELADATSRLLKRVESVSTLSAEQRLAAFLLERDRLLATAPQPWPRQSQLASLLSVSPETLSRLLARFKRRGWIERDRKGIEVRDRSALKGLLTDAAT